MIENWTLPDQWMMNMKLNMKLVNVLLIILNLNYRSKDE